MNNPLKSDPVKQGKSLAQQIAQEPFEIAKSAVKQVTGLETSINSQQTENVHDENQNKLIEDNKKLLDQKQKAQGQRQLQALENEMEEIVEKKKIEKQKQELVQNQEDILKEEEENSPLLIPSSKKPRNIFAAFGKKQKQGGLFQAERQKRRVERIMPPTG